MTRSAISQKLLAMVLIVLLGVILPLWLLWSNAVAAGAVDNPGFIPRFFFRGFILCGVPTIYWLEACVFLRWLGEQQPAGAPLPADKLAETLAHLVLLCLVSNSLMGFFSMADEQYIRTLPASSGVDVMRFGVAIIEVFPKLYFPMGVMVYAFWGAFVYNNYNFIRRLRSNDFSPQVFMAGALRVVLAVLAAGLLYYAGFTDAYVYSIAGTQVLAEPNKAHTLAAGWLVVGAFFAGLYPQQMITAIFSWFYSRITQVFPMLGKYQYTPMTILQGVTLDVELRLKEEGIDSLQALSICDAAQLAAKTPYSIDAIKDWQDQAKLAAYFSDGEQFATLASLGIRSYSALKSYQLDVNKNPTLADTLKQVDTSPIAKDKFQHFVRFGVFP